VTASENRYAHIDAMRAIAVMLVVVAHAGLGGIVPGGSGVTIFFSISGFIITYLLLRENDATGGFGVRAFYVRRLMKIGPPLLVCVLIPTIILGFFESVDWSTVVSIVFFYFNWLSVSGVDAPLPGSGVVWSLSIEEQFYLGFALLWLCLVRSRSKIRLLALLAGTAVVYSNVARITLASSPDIHENRIYFGSDTRLDGIALGILTAIAFHHALSEPGWVRRVVVLCSRNAALFAALSLYLFSLAVRDEWFRSTFRFTFQAVAACIVILYGFGDNPSAVRTVFNAVTRLRQVQFLGLASYSIYLIHLTAMYYSGHLFSTLPHPVAVVLLIAVGTGAGMLVYLSVERPVQRYRQRAQRSTQKPAVQGSRHNRTSKKTHHDRRQKTTAA